MTCSDDNRPAMGPNNEAVYDEQIAPLMAQIIAICNEHRMPVTATFEYQPGQLCSTRIPFFGEAPEHEAAMNLLRRGFAAFTVSRKAGVVLP